MFTPAHILKEVQDEFINNGGEVLITPEMEKAIFKGLVLLVTNIVSGGLLPVDVAKILKTILDLATTAGLSAKDILDIFLDLLEDIGYEFPTKVVTD